MRFLPAPGSGLLAFVCVIASSASAFACDRIPAGEPLWIRLAASVSTYTAKVGDPVHGVLTQDLVCGDEIVLPMGTTVEGVVRSKRKVGFLAFDTRLQPSNLNSIVPTPNPARPWRSQPVSRKWRMRVNGFARV